MTPNNRVISAAEEVDKSVRVIASAPQEEIDWAILRLVFGVNLRLNDGLQTKTPTETLSTEEKVERLSPLSDKFEVSEKEIRTVAMYPHLCNNGTITRAGLHYLLRDVEGVEESIERLLIGGLLVQRATNEFGFVSEFSTIYPTKLGDKFLKNMYDVLPTLENRGIPPGGDPNMDSNSF